MFILAFFIVSFSVFFIGMGLVIVSVRHHIRLARQKKQVSRQIPEGNQS